MDQRDPDENGWASSAGNWIEGVGDAGDFSRQFVLDAPMIARVRQAAASTALDIGCGEGRFCRRMRDLGVTTTGLDPVSAMIDAAKMQDPHGQYLHGFAEDLPCHDAHFDLVVSYLSLIDIDGTDRAVPEMARVLKPGGRILVANLSSFATSSSMIGRRHCKDTDEILRPLGRYLEAGKAWFEWDGLRVQNWHRPLSHYMQLFLQQGLILTLFDEPKPQGGPPERVNNYADMPYLMMMEWQKPSV
ncbi:MAG: class I SAM-dependent methyltransferase [Pseudomonadota bacterium]